MIQKMYSIKDTVKGQFLGIYMEDTDAAAVRAFETLINDYNTVVGRYPSDHQLYYLGEYNTETGELDDITVKFIVQGAALRKRGNNIVLQQNEQTEDDTQ